MREIAVVDDDSVEEQTEVVANDPGEAHWENVEKVIDTARIFSGNAGEPYVFVLVYDNHAAAETSNIFVGTTIPKEYIPALVANAVERTTRHVESQAGDGDRARPLDQMGGHAADDDNDDNKTDPLAALEDDAADD